MLPFTKDHAQAYDSRFAKVDALKESLHLLLRILLGDLPERARILCVGVGTGAELLALARAFPGFEFVAVEPSEAMLEICREKAGSEGIASRCRFFQGYIQDLPAAEPFDAATSLLVSQFITHRADRVRFFAEIARRLGPSGYLVNADLSADLESEAADGLKEFWGKMQVYLGTPEEKAYDYLVGWERNVAVLPPAQVEGMILEGGFGQPTLFYQSLFIHGWFARRAG